MICIIRDDFPIPVPPLMIMEEPRVIHRLPMRLSGSFFGSKSMRSLTVTMVDWSSSVSRAVSQSSHEFAPRLVANNFCCDSPRHAPGSRENRDGFLFLGSMPGMAE